MTTAVTGIEVLFLRRALLKIYKDLAKSNPPSATLLTIRTIVNTAEKDHKYSTSMSGLIVIASLIEHSNLAFSSKEIRTMFSRLLMEVSSYPPGLINWHRYEF